MKIQLFFIIFICANISFAIEQKHQSKPKLILLKKYKNQNISGWLVSEKLDGVRAYWDGKKLISRSGKIFYPPKFFLQGFPNFPIDGELWSKRDDFYNIVSIVRSSKNKQRWKELKFNIFEVPNQKGGLLQRLSVLEQYLKIYNPPYIKIIGQKKLHSKKELKDILDNISSKKGEGLVVRKADELYKTGRLKTSLKVKKQFDMDCMVVKIDFYEKINKVKRIGCRLKNNQIIKIGTGFSKDMLQPKIGDKITFKYYGFTKNHIPKFASYLRIKKEF
jgi:DNA ligase-1